LAFSFQVATADQAETDRYWNAIVGNGGEESVCGWCKDKWGLSWQITPLALTRAITDPDPAAAKRAFDAMMQMKKIDIAASSGAPRLKLQSSKRACPLSKSFRDRAACDITAAGADCAPAQRHYVSAHDQDPLLKTTECSHEKAHRIYVCVA